MKLLVKVNMCLHLPFNFDMGLSKKDMVAKEHLCGLPI